MHPNNPSPLDAGPDDFTLQNSPDIHQDRILILDFGSQYSQLIARRVREAGVYSEIRPYDLSEIDLRAFAPKGIILSGGPESVILSPDVRVPEYLFELGVPILGICYGMHTMAMQLGGDVEVATHREFGYAQVSARGESHLLQGIEDHSSPEGHGLLDVWMSHGDRVSTLPPGFRIIAETANAPCAGMAHEEHRLYGLQFHPEVTHTRQGSRILRRFVQDICGCGNRWTPDNIIEDAIHKVRETVGDDEVLLALSGGVDSSVVAALLYKAIGDRLHCIFVDNGLLRLSEGDQVMATFAEHLGVHVIRVDAEDRFLGALEGVTDPERKRKIIGNLFITLFEEAAERLHKPAAPVPRATNTPLDNPLPRAVPRWLAQGTIYPDVIESAGAATGKAHVIKSHHNVGGLPERMNMGLIEPLRELFKDEVRSLGTALGLPAEMVYRHPFPGPGLAVRILGAVKKSFADTLRLADAIFIEELRANGLYDQVSQAFAVFLPVQSVGVMGDGRRYEYVIALRAVETVDFMTARWARLPYEVLDRISTRIINDVPGISRVTYDISGKPPATIEWE
uniref:GMP synthase [glutamine-hydrolyzing] n=1 Tax=Candidatus Kentrum eta TaxID=2126337 RepID=A0A450VDK8_9GAMM|nr:MAG: GMP synthase (glutamine-hydrolysing) [Candidatus Kentron sp. H]VFK02886.1 MAG: GMP synthase (glutamine-hydrolysing) [Candidatus Kentron sp. H]VFK05628.1 MAG: GMP synthase (glutamine-hydrolysing) [Candidatus Kentron sp. H]